MRGGILEVISVVQYDYIRFLHFFGNGVLTILVGGDYNPLTNEGGGAAGDRRTRSEVSEEMTG